MTIAVANKFPSRGATTDVFPSSSKRNLVLSLVLILLTVLIYARVGQNGFINFDDNSYLTRNPHISSGLSWETVKWAFSTYDAANWHPLTWLSHALDVQLFGVTPSAHHFVNVLIHAVNVVLLFLLLQTITGLTWPSVMVAAIFAVHPLNVESVAWVAERKNLLSMLFFLLTLTAYCRYVRRRSVMRYLGVAGLFAFALMSKPQVITLPFVLLLLDYWPLRRTRFVPPPAAMDSVAQLETSFLWLLAEKIPLFLLSALSAVITLRAQHMGHAVRTVVEYSPTSRMENAAVSYAAYLRDIFFPYHFAPIYPHPVGLLPGWEVALASVLLVSCSVAVIQLRRHAPYLLFGWFWFLGTLVPMIGLVQVGEQARADRYMYLPMIGILVAVIWGITEAFNRFRVLPMAGAGLYGSLLAALSIVTYRQIGHWHDSETLWNYTLSVTKDNFMAEDNLAQELATQGRTEEALVHFHRILNMHNWQASDLIAFGMYEQRNGYASDAIKQYQRALQSTTDASTRAVALSDIGSAYMDLKDLNDARGNFEHALQLDPYNVPALIGTGLIAQKTGNLNLAVAQYAEAVSIKPSDLGYQLLGRAFEQVGRPADADEAYRHAQQLSPDIEATRSAAKHLLSE